MANVLKKKLSKSGILVLAFVTIFSLTFFGVFPLSKTQAGTLANLVVAASSSTPGATATYTITFTPQTTIPQFGGMIGVMFPQSQGQPGQPPQPLFDLSGVTKNSVRVNGVIPADVFTGNSDLNIMVPFAISGGTATTLIINNVKNTTKAGTYSLVVATMTPGEPGQPPIYLDGDFTKGLYATNIFTIGTPSIIGRLVDPQGSGIGFTHVMVFPAGQFGSNKGNQPGQSYEANTDANGYFSFSNVPSGSYKIEFHLPRESPYLAPSIPPFTVTSGATFNLGTKIAVSPTKTITGKVVKKNGGAVSDATVLANKRNGGGHREANTGSDGKFTLNLSGGAWDLFVRPAFDPQTGTEAEVDWAYQQAGPPASISFKDDASSESKSYNFTVLEATATLKGTVRKSNGSILDQPVGVEFRSKEGLGNQGMTKPGTGNFSVKVPGGTYNFSVFPSPQMQDQAAPALEPISISDNQTKNLGTITLVKKNEHIRGKVVEKDSGSAVAGVKVNAFMREGMGFAMTQSGADGSFDLLVSPGPWGVHLMAEKDSDYVYMSPPIDVSLKKDEIKSIGTLSVLQADATILVTAEDSKTGIMLTDIFGFAFANSAGKKGPGGPGLGAPLEQGQAAIKVPAGTYNVGIGMPPEGAGYMATDFVSVSVASGGQASATVKLAPTDSVISGRLVDNNGKLVKVPFEVFADNGKGAFTHSFAKDGRFNLNVIGGTWYIGFHIPEEFGYISQPPTKGIKVQSGKTKTVKLKTIKADSEISGQVLDPNGSPVPNAFVSADKISRKGVGFSFHLGSPTDNEGRFYIKAPAGSYEVRAHAPSEFGYLNPKAEKVIITPSSPQAVNFVFKKSDAKISGYVVLKSKTQPAFVYAYSQNGGYAEDFAGNDGSFTLNVEKGETWYVGANSESGDNLYQSEEIEIAVNGNERQDLFLTKTGTLPSSQTVTFDASAMQVITLENGVKISIPAGAIASSGNITVVAEPKGKLAFQRDAQPLDIGYDLTALDENGQEIEEKFNSNVTITIPYSQKQLNRFGISEDDLIPSYWDETTSTWKKADNVTIDKKHNKVIIVTNHFTKFANITKKAKKRIKKVTPADADYEKGAKTLNLSLRVNGITLASSGIKVKVGKKELANVKVERKNKVSATLSYGGMEPGIYDLTVSYPEKIKVAKVTKKKKGSRKVKVKYTTKTVQKSVTLVNGFTIFGEEPQITSFSPNSRKYTKKKGANLVLTVEGNNFTDDSEVQIGSVSANRVVYKNSGHLIAYFKVKRLSKGKQEVIVVNRDGQKAQAAETFLVKKKKK
jgi:hypothetical protein